MARRAPESEERVEALYQKLRAKMPLHELRQAQALSQDMYISTLRNYIRAMGGELEIIATFPEGQVKIENFAN